VSSAIQPVYVGERQWEGMMKNDAFRRAPRAFHNNSSESKIYLGIKWVRR
jgi:hypothetical protein